MIELQQHEVSRRDTTHAKTRHLRALPMFERAGTRGWTHRAMSIRVAESRKDRAEVAEVIKRRHYLARWPARPRTLILSYIASLGEGGEGAAAVVMIALLPSNYGELLTALDLHPCSVLQLARAWRADDCGPETAPDFLPEVLRRIVKRLAADWEDKTAGRLQARPRLLLSYADPAVGHDGALYVGAGAVPLGPTRSGRLAFAWALDPLLREPLRDYARGIQNRARA